MKDEKSNLSEAESSSAGQKQTAWMPQKTLILIIVLAIITAVLLVLALYTKIPTKSAHIVTTKTPVVVVHAYTTLTIAQAVASNSAYGHTYAADINISTKSNKVTAVQLQIAYNPNSVTITDITAGSFFNNPDILFEKIDPEAGIITYSLGVGLGQKPVSGSGTVATIKFIPISGQKSVVLSVLPTSEVAAQGEVKSVLKSASKATLQLVSPTQ